RQPHPLSGVEPQRRLQWSPGELPAWTPRILQERFAFRALCPGPVWRRYALGKPSRSRRCNYRACDRGGRSDIPNGTKIQFHRETSGFAMTAGGGLDIKLSRHVAFRPIQAEYFLTRLSPIGAFGVTSRNNFRYSAGVNFLIGGEQPTPAPPPPPATKKCPDGSVVPANQACPKLTATLGLTATPTDLCEGEKAQLTVTNNAPSSTFAYTWSVNGQPVGQPGSQQSFTLDSTGMPAGTYTIAVHATGNGFNPASAETTINVKAYEPPMGTVQANP